MEAMDIYTKLSKPPKEVLKKITGGRLNGKTDINPQWRYKVMTEQFGLCGIGWKYAVERQWTEQGTGGEIVAFVNLSVYIKDGDKWSDPIPGSGGSMLVAKEKSGLYTSDEAFKMATTDALSVALKFLGVASAIYAGQWDGTKYMPSDGDGTSQDDYKALMQWMAHIDTASDMDELKHRFGDAWKQYPNNIQAQKELTAAKDNRKKELAK